MEMTIKENEIKKNAFGFTEIKGTASLEEKGNIIYFYDFSIFEDTAENRVKILSSKGSCIGELVFNENVKEIKKEIKGENKEVITLLLNELFNEYFGEKK